MASKDERLARRLEQRLVRATMGFSGPIPPPAMLAQYNEVIPNGAERIMTMAEQQQKHRHVLEHKAVHSNATDQRLGVVLGFVGMMVVAGLGAWLVWLGKDIAGAAALVASVGAPVSAFIYGRRRQEDERQHKI
jgi:uncharacterized membrane protein